MADHEPQQKKGEMKEIADQLAQPNLNTKKAAMKRIIGAMTYGVDVSPLFTEIVKNMENTNMELKKLIYLYVINYAKIHPDLIIMAINSFRKDALDKNNPLLRALAVRTMGCIRVSQITEYLVDPLKEALLDEDSYVKKTGVICVAKLYESNPELIEQLGFIEMLNQLQQDGNPMVVSNTVAALQMISERKGVNLLIVNHFLAHKLLNAMNEATEWGQTFIQDAFVHYTPTNIKDCEEIQDRVAVSLSHRNPGIVLSAARIIMKLFEYITNTETIREYSRRLTPALISLMTAGPEFQYVVLKNINVIIQKRPILMERDIKSFFCDFNDPFFIKLEKLDILVKLADVKNIDQILHQLKEYVTEVDVEFVRRSVRTIGKLAIKLERVADRCVNTLYECLKTKAEYVIQEAIVVMRDIFRKYPKKYVKILGELCSNLKSLDEPEAKASMIWIIGEYVESIENAPEILGAYLDGFADEPQNVQLTLMNSCVRLYLSRPNDGKPILTQIFKIIEESESPDLRDRGYLYWRMLAKNPKVAQQLVCMDKPLISDQDYTCEQTLLNKLVENISNLSPIYEKPPEAFVKLLRESQNQRWEEMEELKESEMLEGGFVDSTGQVMGSYQQSIGTNEYTDGLRSGNIDFMGSGKGGDNQMMQQQPNQPVDLMGEIPDNQQQMPPQQQQMPPQEQQMPPQQQQMPPQQQQMPPQQQQMPPQQQMGNIIGDPFADSGPNQQQPKMQQQSNSTNIKIPFNQVISESDQGVQNKASGLKVEAVIQREADMMQLDIRISNFGQVPVSNLAVKMDANSYKLATESMSIDIDQVLPGQTRDARVQINTKGESNNEPPVCPFRLQLALNSNLDIFVFNIPCSFSVLQKSPPPMSVSTFNELMNRPNQVKARNSFQTTMTQEEFKQKLINNNINFVFGQTNDAGVEMMSFHCLTVDDMEIGVQTILCNGGVNIQYQTPHPVIVPLVFQAIKFIHDF